MEYSGIAASEGIAVAKAVLLIEEKPVITDERIKAGDVAEALEKLELALKEALGEIERCRQSAIEKLGKKEASIFEAHSMLLADPEYLKTIRQKISEELYNPSYAVDYVTEQFLILFESINDSYLRERAADLRDVSGRLLRKLNDIKSRSILELDSECIIIAKDFTPSDTVQINPEKVKGFISEMGGYTSHSAIMARSIQLPAVVGAASVAEHIMEGDLIILDGFLGKIFVNPSADILNSYEEKRKAWLEEQETLKSLLHEPALTKDGIKVELVANIGNPREAEVALQSGAEGVGLYRTEFLFLGKEFLPSEAEQFEAYSGATEVFQNKPIVIRTLDIGGDKEVKGLKLEKEMNPFLGFRAIRLSLDRQDMFKIQLRAILKASVYSDVKIMFPMIASIQEFRDARALVFQVMEELDAELITYNKDIEIGIMVEIPAAAVLADLFAVECDFFSIGTNDLIQYTMAADRMNEKVSYLYQPFNPSVLRLINNVIKASHKEGKWTGMCGEMASDLIALPILVGMGLDEFSMNSGAILKIKNALRKIDSKKAALTAEKVLNLASSEEVIAVVKEDFPELFK